jgi:imidazole glycerol-phosphate synthase subunit HisF
MIPAIDVLDGRVVRLAQGDFARVTVFGDDPLEIAAEYRRAGATRLHLVDLSAARSGVAGDRFLELVAKLSQDFEVQVGGGARDLQAIERRLDAGAAAVVIGTMLFADAAAARAAVDLFGAGRLIAALDVDGQEVKTHGWRQGSGRDLAAAMRWIDELGIRRVLMTDIARDGMAAGPNVALYAEWKRRFPHLELTASGGVRNESDLAELETAGCDAVVVGKALLEGSVPLDACSRYDAPHRNAPSGAGDCPNFRVSENGTVPLGGLAVRVIPCLDVTEGRVVKGTNFQNLRDAGDPVELARRYCDEGADELVFLDITATSDRRQTLTELAARVADAVNIPFTVGGGVRCVGDARRLLDAGADKVAVNSAAVARPALLEEMAAQLGSANTVCAIDARRQQSGGWTALVRGGRDDARIDAIAWAEEAVRRGAGELLVTSHDRDGTAAGFDTALLSEIKARVSVPVIASGGGGSLSTFVDAVRLGRADAVLAASVLHFGIFSIREIKTALRGASFPVRP